MKELKENLVGRRVMVHMNKKGFTLIEVITSIAILAIIMIMFTTVFTSVMKTSVASVNANESSLAAQGNLENSSYGTEHKLIFSESTTGISLEIDVFEYTGESNGVDYYEFR